MSTHRLSVAVALILVLQTNLVCGQFSAAPIEFKGEVGEKGARGAVGSTGVQGQTGSKGVRGDPGLTGNTGENGLRGTDGRDAGGSGATGQPGNTGSTGDKGAVGLTGSTGATGPTGATGASGAPGASGQRGVTGSKGGRGSRGDEGDIGISGKPGLTGSQGANGQKGQQGDRGIIGVKGFKGYPLQVNTGSDTYDGCVDLEGYVSNKFCSDGTQCVDFLSTDTAGDTHVTGECIYSRGLRDDSGMQQFVSTARDCTVNNGGCEQSCVDGQCQCEAGYTLRLTGQCVDIDECKDGSHRCSTEQSCLNTYGTYQCAERSRSYASTQASGEGVILALLLWVIVLLVITITLILIAGCCRSSASTTSSVGGGSRSYSLGIMQLNGRWG